MSISRRADLKAPPRPEARELPRLLESPDTIEDLRQEAKVRNLIAHAVLLAVAAVAGNAGTRVGIELRAKAFAGVLGEPLHIGRIPSHDAIQRVMGLSGTVVPARIYLMWRAMMDFEAETPESPKGLKLPDIDRKTLGTAADAEGGGPHRERL